MSSENKHDVLLNGHRVNSLGVAKALDRGIPPDVYKEGQKCKICGATLRRTNPYDVCSSHIEKTVQDIQDRRVRPKDVRQFDTLTDTAMRVLEVKKRKPLPRPRIRNPREFQ